MGVYLPNMDMPISCGWCPLMHGTCEGDECYVGAKITEYQKRPEDCPLFHVPRHGRLGDLDALKAKAIERSEKCGVCVNVLDNVITAYDIETAPTIIPANQAEEGET